MTGPLDFDLDLYTPFSVTFFAQAGSIDLVIPESERQILARSTWFRLTTGNWRVVMINSTRDTVSLQANRQGILGWDVLTTLDGAGDAKTAISEMVSVSTGGTHVDLRPRFNSPPSTVTVANKHPVTLEFIPVPVFDGTQLT